MFSAVHNVQQTLIALLVWHVSMTSALIPVLALVVLMLSAEYQTMFLFVLVHLVTRAALINVVTHVLFWILLRNLPRTCVKCVAQMLIVGRWPIVLCALASQDILVLHPTVVQNALLVEIVQLSWHVTSKNVLTHAQEYVALMLNAEL